MWHYDGMWTDGHMLGWGMWGWGMMLFGIVWMAFLIGIPLYLVSRFTNRTQLGGERQSDDRALEVLHEQYARGEIDEEEFERRRSRLS
ncbi:SHOCT domain-containing protein [Halolamina sp. C58]|uniref:SHOCT domain-containing protein n=1 Tax=Halolamina sp. C58 TaxID=3421640 RepID=UPI003EBBA88D